MTAELFIAGMALGVIFATLWVVLIDTIVQREAERQADACGRALTPGVTSGYDTDLPAYPEDADDA
jgi:hypothetical protein